MARSTGKIKLEQELSRQSNSATKCKDPIGLGHLDVKVAVLV